ncbi:MAG: hypothetical protein AB203_04205 [Parcubacteria bacterium C7867-008]|nr:MAG: hypothetical protein AB203_04205 [Parcubacteria bacterium C7867-008]
MADPLETLRARLYASKPVETVAPNTLSQTRAPAASAWAPPPPPVIKPPHKKLPPSLWFLIIAGGFFLITGIAAALFLVFGGRSISAEHVTIEVPGQTTIASGDAVPILISVKNENPVAMLNATITVDLPEGTRDANDPNKALDQFSDSLGDIAPDTRAERTVNAILFGSENQILTIPIKVEYRTPGSNAVSVKEQKYFVTVTTSPVSVNVQGMKEVESGGSVTVRVNVRSNATTPLKNIALLGAYPPGFIPASASPAASTGSYFLLGELAPGQEKIITVTGTLSGSEGDDRVFTFTVGTAKDDGSPALGIPYMSNQAAVAIAKPFLGVTVSLNRENGDVVTVPSGQSVQGNVSWRNSLGAPIANGQVFVKFSGNAFDPATVVAANGYYRSSDSTIVFNKESTAGLALLQPNDTGAGTFTFRPKQGVRNPTVNLLVTVVGTRAGTGGGALTSTLTRTLKIGTGLSLSSKILHTSGGIPNTGPIPPTANQETTYTVQLTAQNSLNGVGGAVVTTKLPAYVRYTGVTSAGGTPITYDETDRTVSWNIGELTPDDTKTVSFQVAVLPSIAQKGTSPIVIPTQALTATDRFTQQQVTASANALTTQTPGDTGYSSDKGVVK